jgi:uncharacterized tellurite resistance protein B-like protein
MARSQHSSVFSRVSPTDHLPFLKALAHIAAIDNSVTVDEEEMVVGHADAWDLSESEWDDVRQILDSGSSLSLDALVGAFSESGTRLLLVEELVRLSYADGTYGDAEREEVAAIAKRMDLTDEQLDELEEWIGRGQAWDLDEEADGPGSDALQEVIDGDEESEHDLSDIETGEYDLSDLGYGAGEEDS